MKQVYISGAAAVSGAGFAWRDLGGRVVEGTAVAPQVPDIPTAIDVDARSRKLMSHAARLSAVALRLALEDAAWPQPEREAIAFYLGVGASGCSMEELNRMLAASISERQFSHDGFGGAGLAACNPLFAFQLMNNFTLCHGAILHGTAGPNGAFYSRGTGTVAALAEAHWLVASGECGRALAGGADSALHPVTAAQLMREGWNSAGLVGAEGAALLALSNQAEGALGRVERTTILSARALAKCPIERLRELVADATRDDLILIAPWGDAVRADMHAALEATRAKVIDCSAVLGDALAAAPALAWNAALSLLQGGTWQRAFVLNAGIDGGAGLAVIGSVA